MDAALHYGTGVFEGIRSYDTGDGGAIFRLREHLERLERSAELINLPMPMTVAELTQGCLDLLRANGLTECYLRPLVFAGHDSLGVHADNAAEPLIRSDLKLADEIFLTSTAAEIVWVAELDGRCFDRSSQSRAAAERYSDIVRGRVADHRDWLTPLAAGVRA